MKTESAKSKGSGPEYRIMILGESTSTSVGVSSGEEWPEQLKGMLSSMGRSVVVRNLAISATTFLVDEALSIMDDFRPHLVISMMGVNDALGSYLLKSDQVKTKHWYKGLKLFRLMTALLKENSEAKRMIYTATPEELTEAKLKEMSIVPVTKSKELRSKIKRWVDHVGTLRDSEKYAYLDERVSGLDFEERGQALAILGLEHFNDDIQDGAVTWLPWKLLSRLLFTQLKVYSGVLETYAFYSVNLGISKFVLQALEKYAEQKIPISSLALGRIAHALKMTPELAEEWDRVVSVYGYTYEKLLQASATQFLRLSKKLKATGVCHIALSYPVRSDENLQSLFSSDPQLRPEIIVSQKESFGIAYREHTRDELFTDMFAGDFGHTTRLGHALIAEAAKKAVLSLPERCELRSQN